MPKAETFVEFLRSRKQSRGIRRDFVEDVKRDKQFPRNVESWRKLEFYLIKCSACAEAIEAARGLWKEYEKQKRRVSDVSIASEGERIIDGILRVVTDESCSEAALVWATRRLARSSLDRKEAEQRLFEAAVTGGWTCRQAREVIDKSWPRKPKQTEMKL